jgi:hypothetical protein
MLFTTKKILESETSMYDDIYIFELIEEKTFRTVSIGIGYGGTAQDAKFNAYTSLNRAIALGGNTGYVVFENGEIKGPIKKRLGKINKIIDKRFSDISQSTGISINTIYNIYNAAIKCNNQTFSSKEISKLCGINQRSMDRFLQKLEVYDFIEIIGKKMEGKSGRSSRIIKLKFF